MLLGGSLETTMVKQPTGWEKSVCGVHSGLSY